MNRNSSFRPDPRDQSAQARLGERHAAGGRPQTRPCHVNENGAAATPDPRAGIMVQLDQEIVEMVITPQPIAATHARHRDWSVVAAIGRILAPAVGRADAAHPQQGSRARVAVSAPPYAHRPEATSRGCAIALALVGPYSGSAERNRLMPGAKREPSLRKRAGAHMNVGQGYAPHGSITIVFGVTISTIIACARSNESVKYALT